MYSHLKLYFAEFFGAFIIVFLGTGSIICNEETGGLNHLIISINFGVAVFLAILLFAKTSGAHCNPAVSITMYLKKVLTVKELWVYILFQISGGIAASIILSIVFPGNQNLGSTMPRGSVIESFLLEFFMSLILMLTILSTSGIKRFKIFFSALMIGAVVGLEAFFGGSVSGASMNPARSIGPAIISGNISTLWIYIVAPVLGMASTLFLIKIVSALSNKKSPN